MAPMGQFVRPKMIATGITSRGLEGSCSRDGARVAREVAVERRPNSMGVPPALPGWQQKFDLCGGRPSRKLAVVDT